MVTMTCTEGMLEVSRLEQIGSHLSRGDQETVLHLDRVYSTDEIVQVMVDELARDTEAPDKSYI